MQTLQFKKVILERLTVSSQLTKTEICNMSASFMTPNRLVDKGRFTADIVCDLMAEGLVAVIPTNEFDWVIIPSIAGVNVVLEGESRWTTQNMEQHKKTTSFNKGVYVGTALKKFETCGGSIDRTKLESVLESVQNKTVDSHQFVAGVRTQFSVQTVPKSTPALSIVERAAIAGTTVPSKRVSLLEKHSLSDLDLVSEGLFDVNTIKSIGAGLRDGVSATIRQGSILSPGQMLKSGGQNLTQGVQNKVADFVDRIGNVKGRENAQMKQQTSEYEKSSAVITTSMFNSLKTSMPQNFTMSESVILHGLLREFDLGTAVNMTNYDKNGKPLQGATKVGDLGNDATSEEQDQDSVNPVERPEMPKPSVSLSHNHPAKATTKQPITLLLGNVRRTIPKGHSYITIPMVHSSGKNKGEASGFVFLTGFPVLDTVYIHDEKTHAAGDNIVVKRGIYACFYPQDDHISAFKTSKKKLYFIETHGEFINDTDPQTIAKSFASAKFNQQLKGMLDIWKKKEFVQMGQAKLDNFKIRVDEDDETDTNDLGQAMYELSRLLKTIKPDLSKFVDFIYDEASNTITMWHLPFTMKGAENLRDPISKFNTLVSDNLKKKTKAVSSVLKFKYAISKKDLPVGTEFSKEWSDALKKR